MKGGVCLIRSLDPVDIISIPIPDLYVTIIHPQIEIRTAEARQILPEKILLKDAIKQWGNVAGLVAGFFQKDPDLIGRSMTDVIIEPVRSALIPGYDEIKMVSKNAGALGGGISGSGPSMYMLSKEEQTAGRVESAMKEVYDRIGIGYLTYVTRIGERGVRVVNG
jgi:homoserine kinase